MSFTVNGAFVRAFKAQIRELIHQRTMWIETPEQRFWRKVEFTLVDLFNEAEAWAYAERSMRYYAGRA